LFVAVPHLEEFWRCWRARQRGLSGVDTPECARELFASWCGRLGCQRGGLRLQLRPRDTRHYESRGRVLLSVV